MYQYEIVRTEEYVRVCRVFAGTMRRDRCLVAEVIKDATLAEIAQEFYEVLAAVNENVVFVKED